MKIQPEEGYVVCQAVDTSKLSSGLYVPDQKGTKKYLQVIETASKQYKKKTFVVPKAGVMEVEVELQHFFLLHEDDICATIVK